MIGNGAIRAMGRRRASAVSAGYAPDAVNFDGSADSMTRSSGFTGIASNKTALFSTWFTIEGGNGTNRDFGQFRDVSSNWRWIMRLGTDNKFRFLARNVSNSTILDVKADTAYTASSGTWHHLVFAMDLSSTTVQFYIDDALVTHTTTTKNNDTVDYANADLLTICATTTPANRWNGDIADYYFTNEYLDMSNATNRAKFIDAGLPVSLGSDGSTPTGTQAVVFYSGDATLFNAGTNAGSGGDFTMTGAVTNSANEPVGL